MAKYRKKPVVIEARQMPEVASAAEAHDIYLWIEGNTLGSFEPTNCIDGARRWPKSGVSIDPRDGRMIIATLEGAHWVNPGDYVIRGVKGEFYPCKPDIFEATYDPVEGGANGVHDAMQPTTELRFVDRQVGLEAARPEIIGDQSPAVARRAKILQQLWTNAEGTCGHWRDVEVVSE